MRAAIVQLVILSFLGGCVIGPSDSMPSTRPETSSLTVSYEGVAYWRVPGHAVVGCDIAEPGEGDPSAFGVRVPGSTLALDATFTWMTPQQMVLQLFDPEDEFPDYEAAGLSSPLRLRVDHPVPGDWFVYAGPGAAGGATSWQLVLTWTTNVPIEPADVVSTETC